MESKRQYFCWIHTKSFIHEKMYLPGEDGVDPFPWPFDIQHTSYSKKNFLFLFKNMVYTRMEDTSLFSKKTKLRKSSEEVLECNVNSALQCWMIISCKKDTCIVLQNRIGYRQLEWLIPYIDWIFIFSIYLFVIFFEFSFRFVSLLFVCFVYHGMESCCHILVRLSAIHGRKGCL